MELIGKRQKALEKRLKMFMKRDRRILYSYENESGHLKALNDSSNHHRNWSD
jgi:hypothetical protein